MSFLISGPKPPQSQPPTLVDTSPEDEAPAPTQTAIESACNAAVSACVTLRTRRMAAEELSKAAHARVFGCEEPTDSWIASCPAQDAQIKYVFRVDSEPRDVPVGQPGELPVGQLTCNDLNMSRHVALRPLRADGTCDKAETLVTPRSDDGGERAHAHMKECFEALWTGGKPLSDEAVPALQGMLPAVQADGSLVARISQMASDQGAADDAHSLDLVPVPINTTLCTDDSWAASALVEDLQEHAESVVKCMDDWKVDAPELAGAAEADFPEFDGDVASQMGRVFEEEVAAQATALQQRCDALRILGKDPSDFVDAFKTRAMELGVKLSKDDKAPCPARCQKDKETKKVICKDPCGPDEDSEEEDAPEAASDAASEPDSELNITAPASVKFYRAHCGEVLQSLAKAVLADESPLARKDCDISLLWSPLLVRSELMATYQTKAHDALQKLSNQVYASAAAEVAAEARGAATGTARVRTSLVSKAIGDLPLEAPKDDDATTLSTLSERWKVCDAACARGLDELARKVDREQVEATQKQFQRSVLRMAARRGLETKASVLARRLDAYTAAALSSQHAVAGVLASQAATLQTFVDTAAQDLEQVRLHQKEVDQRVEEHRVRLVEAYANAANSLSAKQVPVDVVSATRDALALGAGGAVDSVQRSVETILATAGQGVPGTPSVASALSAALSVEDVARHISQSSEIGLCLTKRTTNNDETREVVAPKGRSAIELQNTIATMSETLVSRV